MATRAIFKSETGKQEIHRFYQNLLDQWKVETESYYIETSLGKTFLISAGDCQAPPLLLLHGSGSSSAMWSGDISVFAQHFNVYAIDIPGECGFSSEARPKFQNNIYANWLLEIIDSLTFNSVCLGGCSLGGWIALETAILYPKKISKLFLNASAGLTNIKSWMLFWVILASFMGNAGFRKLNRIVYGGLEVDQQALEFASLLKQHYKPRTDVLPIFSDHELQRIKASVFFFGGENDCFYDTQKSAVRVENHIQKSKSEVLSDTGHVVTGVTPQIIEFLTKA